VWWYVGDELDKLIEIFVFGLMFYVVCSADVKSWKTEFKIETGEKEKVHIYKD